MTGFIKSNRRNVLKSAAALGTAAFLPSMAKAQSSIGDILQSPQRGNWDDQFDSAGSSNRAAVDSRLPILSPPTVSYVEAAIDNYRGIVSNGGWPLVNATQRLKVGVRDNSVRQLRQRLIISGDMARNSGESTTFDSFLDAGLKRFQARHGMVADGVMGNYTLAALNIDARTRLGQLETNLVRLRSMSGFLGDRFVMVNIPGTELEAVRNGRVERRHKTIVGRVDRETPVLSSKIHEVILNPYWTAPKSIIRKDIIPLMRKDPTYLTRNKIRLFDGSGQEVAPETVNWSTDEAVALRFRQDPGKINAMSSTKINFHNPHAVYMHDTPQQSLFGKFLRFESSGCVRIQDIRELSTWLLSSDSGYTRGQIEQIIKSGESTPIQMTTPVPVYFVYISAWSTGDRVVHFRDDIYNRDGVGELETAATAL
ncbi:L,D-transpeptidase family protein [Ahrensia marina]|uniref:Amidase n=1 Tax=Ahrensia marina TaxID=1514904 RepID=A0A0N0E7Z6_9HYPH|nr:L,D-transpeptidase family protein [Ahrensia marina]KPB01752.1 amidase [Ahrensia marina]